MVKKTDMQHPENFDEVNKIETTESVISFLKQTAQEIEDERSARARWEQSVDRLQKLRYGVRKQKNHPWPKASNIMIPQIDTDIARFKPSYTNLVFGVNPLATFEPYGPEDVEPARKREQLFDWRMRTKVEFFKPFQFGLDHILGAQGQTVFRIIWKFKTRTYTEVLDLDDTADEVVGAILDPRVDDDELMQGLTEEFKPDNDFEENVKEVRLAVSKIRKGDRRIEMSFLEKEADQPEVIACDVKDDLVVPTDTKHIQDARFIDYKFWLPINDIKIAMQDGKYDEVDDGVLKAWANKSVNSGKGANAYRQNQSEDMVLLHETCVWYDVDGDGIEEKCIVTWPDSDSGAILRFIELPYEHGQWPYIQVKRELTEDGFYASRGLASLGEDFQVAISTSVNQSIDNGTILNSPVVVRRKGILSNAKNRKYLPGEEVETTGPTTDYEIRQVGNVAQGILFQQAQFLKGWSDARMGQTTSGLGNTTDLPGTGSRGKKTAKEVDALISQQSSAQSLDLQVFQQQMAGVYYQIDALYNQFGDEEEELLITGQQPLKVSRTEVQGKFNIVPNGRIDDSSPEMRLRKLFLAVQFSQENPIIKQDELARAVMREIDPKFERFVFSQEEMQQVQQANIQAQETLQAQMLEKAVGTKMIMDDTDVLKEAKLVPIQGKKFAPD